MVRETKDATRGFTEYFDKPKAITQYLETIACVDLFKTEFAFTEKHSDQAEDAGNGISSTHNSLNVNQIRYDDSDDNEMPELARIDSLDSDNNKSFRGPRMSI